MVFAAGFSWFHLIPGVEDETLLQGLGITHHTFIVPSAWFICALLLIFALIARRSLMKAWARPGLERYFADERLSIRTFVELYGSTVYGQMKDILGPKDARAFFPLIGGLFLYIFVSNVIGVIPGFLPPTENINTNVGMAIIVFFVFMAVGLGRDAKGFLGHMWGPVIWLGPLLFLIETIGLVVRPVTLTLRLTGNMFGDHTVLVIMSDLAPWVVPAIFLALAMFVSFIQAYVFSLLSTVYIGLSQPHHDHH